MIAFGIFLGAVSAVGIVRSVHAVATDGHGRVPTRTYPALFTIR